MNNLFERFSFRLLWPVLKAVHQQIGFRAMCTFRKYEARMHTYITDDGQRWKLRYPASLYYAYISLL